MAYIIRLERGMLSLLIFLILVGFPKMVLPFFAALDGSYEVKSPIRVIIRR